MTERAAKPTGTGLSADEFSAAVSAVTSAFGDPTRRDIYLFVRAGTDGGTAAEGGGRLRPPPHGRPPPPGDAPRGRIPPRRAGAPRARRPSLQAVPGRRARHVADLPPPPRRPPRDAARPLARAARPRSG